MSGTEGGRCIGSKRVPVYCAPALPFVEEMNLHAKQGEGTAELKEELASWVKAGTGDRGPRLEWGRCYYQL